MALVITKNFYKAIHHGLSGATQPKIYNYISSPSDSIETSFQYINNINKEHTQTFYFAKDIWKNPVIDPCNDTGLTNYLYPMSILFGTGAIEPTFDDYKMENGFFGPNAIKYTTFVKKMPADFSALLVLSTTIENIKTIDNIEIKEIGLVTGAVRGEPICTQKVGIKEDLEVETTGRYILLAREVLETPVVLAPGESRTFEIAIKF